MKLKTRIAILLTSIITAASMTTAHTGQNQNYYGHGMMWSENGSWMHNGAHMAGYNMWGMGWFGLIIGLTFWILAILGIIFLYQKITEKREENE